LPQQKKELAVLNCKVSRGTFTNEFFIVIQLPGDKILTTVADKSQIVWGANSLDAEDSIDAGVKVSVLGREAGMLLIDLPRETFSQGNRILVPPDMVKFEAATRRAAVK
jgi:hypothetical protein